MTSSLLSFDWLSIFSIAWVVGLVVPSAPGGLGVFESTILLLIGIKFNDGFRIPNIIGIKLVLILSF